MQRLLPAIVLCAGLQSALAAAPDPTPATKAGDTIVQAQLDVRDASPGTVPAGTQVAQIAQPASKTAQDAEHEEHRRPLGMLFAALALMTGIALRRWDMGQR